MSEGKSQTTLTLAATWTAPKVSSANREEELRVGTERLGSVWKFSTGRGWGYARRSDISAREAPTRDAAKAALIVALTGSM